MKSVVSPHRSATRRAASSRRSASRHRSRGFQENDSSRRGGRYQRSRKRLASLSPTNQSDVEQPAHAHFWLSPTVIPLTGLFSASRNRAQKSVAPPALNTAARTTFDPFCSERRLDTPSSITA